MDKKKDKPKSKRSKTTTSQKVVNLATTGMPSPVRKILGMRFVAFFIVASIPLLFVTGVISVEWEDGRPHLTVNREKTAAIKEEAADRIEERIEERREELADNRSEDEGFFRRSDDSRESGFVLGDDREESSRFGERVADRFGDSQAEPEETEEGGPFSRLKGKFQRR